MPKVSTDKTLIKKFLTRGVTNIYPSSDALEEKLMSGERLRVYQGFDPTGPYLHVGHAMGIRALRILQQLGHEVIFLIGDYTAKVGDPDKDTARKILTDEQIERNREGWKGQAAQLIEFEGDNPVQFKRNYDWLSKLSLGDLIKLMSHATVQQMLERDLFDKRMEKGDPIGVQELIYPLMQGYDGVMMEVDMEIGGTDQIFNMLVGRNLSKAYLGKERFVRANTLMEAPDARTMSKTKGNGINLSDSAEEMYGKAMSYSDGYIVKGLELLTDVPMEEISEIEKAIAGGENPMKFKKKMALEIVGMVKGEAEARKAEGWFEATVQRREISDENAAAVDKKGETTLLAFLKEVSADKHSGGEIKRNIEQGGVEVNGQKITNPMEVIDFKSGDTVKLGKREFYKVS